MQKYLLRPYFLLGFSFILSACQAPTTPVQAVPSAVTAPSAARSSPNEDATLIQKMNGYVDCLNRVSERTTDSINRYFSWVNRATGPTCKENYISYGLYELYDDSVATCNQAAQKGPALSPALPDLEKAGTEYAAVNAQLVPLVKKMYDYYN